MNQNSEEAQLFVQHSKGQLKLLLPVIDSKRTLHCFFLQSSISCDITRLGLPSIVRHRTLTVSEGLFTVHAHSITIDTTVAQSMFVLAKTMGYAIT